MIMVDKLLKDINDDGGRTKIHINEVAGNLNGKVEPLSDLVIVESGSNSNGHYIKFGNGLLICFGNVSISNTSETEDHKYGTAVFPMAFINNNYAATITPNAGGIANFGAYTYADAKADQMGIWCTRRSTADITMSYQVFGNWK